VTADNPLTDPNLIKKLIEQAKNLEKNQDLISDSIGKRNFPQGLIPYIVRTNALLSLRKKIKKNEEFHLTHVTSKISKKKHKKFDNFDKNLSCFGGARLTLDEFDDFQTISCLVKKLGLKWINSDFNDISNALNAEPKILSYNQHIIQKSLSEN